MADIIDQANDRAEADLRLAIAATRRQSAPALPYVGQCYNCETPTPPAVRFCDGDCCRDYERRLAAEARR